MAKQIEFEGTIHEFPDDFSDDDIAKALKTSAPVTDAKSRSTGSIPGDVLAGIGASVIQVPVGAYNLARKVAPMLLPPPSEYVQGLTKSPETTAGKLGEFGGTAAQFMVPGGAVTKGVRAMEAIGAGKLATTLARFLGEAGLAGGIEALRTGGNAGAAGQSALTSGLSSAAVQALPPSIRFARGLIKNVNNPTEEAALAALANKIPMSAGQRTGSRAVRRVEQGLENLPGSSARAQQFHAAQEEALANEARTLGGTISPTQTSPYFAGQGIRGKLMSHIASLKSQADTAYTDYRAAAAAQKQRLQVGVKPSEILDLEGNPLPGEPIYQTFEAPVDLLPLKASLKSIYDDLKAAMPVARREASPAFAALEDIMTRKMKATAPGEISKRYMNAVDFDKTLGAIKSLTRNGDNPFLTNQSQGIAKQIIKQGETELRWALKDTGAMSSLKAGREAVTRYHEAAELLNDLHDEPAALYQNLVSGGDRVYDTLQQIHKIAPEQLKTAGRTFVDSLVDKATSEGGFARAAGVMADWKRLGPRTKDLLFGAQTAKDIDQFFLAAKRLTSAQNPSGSAHMLYALGSSGAIGGALIGALFGQQTLSGMAGTIGTTVALPALASRALFTPGGAKLMTQAISVPINSPAFFNAIRGIAALTAPSPGLSPPPQ